MAKVELAEEVVFSILIPAFNASRTIRETVKSVQDQTFSGRYEILICDDASTDDTVEVVESLVGSDEKIKLHRNAENKGVSSSRNLLLDHACGEWIAFLDADDVFLPEKLERSISEIEKAQVDILFHGLGYLTKGGGVRGNIDASEFLPASIIRRSKIGSIRFKTTLPVGEDTDFFRMVKNDSSWVRINDVLTAIRIRPGSLTDRDWLSKRIVEYWHANNDVHITPPQSMEDYVAYYRSLGWASRHNLYRLWLGQKYGRVGAGYLLSGHHSLAFRYLAASIALSPGYLLRRVLNNS